jgi:predicted homoserine dehydrogenase-like protein
MEIFADLERRQRAAQPIRVAVVGTGFFGAGLVRRLAAIPGMVPAVAANRTHARAEAALLAAGVAPAALCRTDDPATAQAALDRGHHVATADLLLPAHLTGIDVVMEATGDVLIGATLALETIRGRKHFIAANVETQATVGPILKTLADEAGVVYSDVAGDEPGMLKALHARCVGLGFAPIVAGNGKGVLKRYATPTSQAEFARANNLQPWSATAAADGTKLAFEMATVANATGMPPATRGMVGPATTLPDLLADFERHGLLAHGPIVDYALGGVRGVFVIVHSDEPQFRQEFRYLKMGDGPYYLFHDPYVLVHYEAPLSAARAALYGAATVAPGGAPVADVATFAKRALRAGERLDGIGGEHAYGLIVRADEARAEGLLPIGLASYARLSRDIARDQPVPRDAVVFEEDNVALDLRRRQDARWAT